MAFLQLSLLGGFHLTVNGQAVHRFRSQREVALLAYLAVETHQPQTRERLANLLWPDKPDAVARQNLRQTLINLRTHLRDDQQAVPFLLTEHNTVQCNLASDATVDVTTFTTALATVATHHHTALAVCTTCLAHLAEAVALYQGRMIKSCASGAAMSASPGIVWRAIPTSSSRWPLARMAACWPAAATIRPCVCGMWRGASIASPSATTPSLSKRSPFAHVQPREAGSQHGN